jgi:hypothetical protein
MTHHAQYLLPGILMSESTTRQLSSRSPKEAVHGAPEGAFCFILYDLPDEIPDLGPEYTVRPKRQNESGRYYLRPVQILNLEQVEALGEDHRILASNMRANRWDWVVRCCTGNFQPFEDDDQVAPG